MNTLLFFQKNLLSSLPAEAWTGIFTVILILIIFGLIAVEYFRTERFRRSVTLGTTVRYQRPSGIIAFGIITRIPKKDSVIIRGIADNKLFMLPMNKIFPI